MVDVTVGARRILTSVVVRESWRTNRWVIVTVVIYVDLAFVVAQLSGLERYFNVGYTHYVYLKTMLALFGVFLAGYVIYVLVQVRPTRRAAHLVGAVRHDLLSPRQLALVLPVMLMLPFATSTFQSLKAMISRLNHFAWDETFMSWDRWLHGGFHPWELLQPLIGYHYVTFVINGLYHVWFLILFATIFAATVMRSDPRFRMQCLLASLLTWVLVGNVMATFLSSAGPCFYAFIVGGPDPYLPLMEYLRDVYDKHGLIVIDVQRWLWWTYETDTPGPGRGISAMPSLHVAMAVIYILFWKRIHPWLGWIAAAFLVITLIGSVHLGYHYAIDGYVAIVVTLLIWWGVGRLLARDRALDAPVVIAARGP